MRPETRPYWTAGLFAVVAAVGLFFLASRTDGDDNPNCGDSFDGYSVYAASSLADAFEAIWDEKRSLTYCPPSEQVSFNFAGSQQLRIQIVEQGGDGFMAFASADRAQMDLAIRDGKIEGEPRLFARNKLVVIVPEDNDAGIESLHDLANDGVKLVLAGEEVPAGAYARAFLENAANDPDFGADYAEAVLDNVVSNEPNVRQVVARVQLGEADAGIVYATDALADVADDVRVIEIPDELNETAEYWIVRREDFPTRDWVDFVDYVLSEAGQDILEEHGFIRVDR